MKNFLIKSVFGGASFFFTALVFLNTYELIANKDIPLATSLNRYTAQDVINKEIKEFSVKQDSRNLNNNSRLDEMSFMMIPSLDVRMPLEEAREIGGAWYQRPSLGHYIRLNEDDYGNIVDYLIYTDKSWRTILDVENIEQGTEIHIVDPKGFDALFEVAEKQILPFDKTFILNKTENRQIILVIEDPDNKRYFGYSLAMKK